MSAARSVGADDAGGVGQPAGEVRRKSLVAADRFGLHPELLGLRQAGRCGQAARCTAPRARRWRPSRRVPGLRATASAMRCQIPLSVRGFAPTCGMNGQNSRLPNSASSGGSTSSTNTAATTSPDAACTPRLRVLGDEANTKRQQGQHNGRVAREDRGSGLPHRHSECGAVILGAAQLFSVPRDEQQRVVGARPEHQHAGDAGRRTVGRACPTASAIALPTTAATRSANADHRERHQPQHRRAVGDDQQQRDDGSRDRQQRDVGPGERVRDVRAERGSAGDLDAQIGGQRRRVAESRSDLTASLSANPDRFASIGTVATAARPSSDTCSGLLLDRGQVGRGERFAVAPADDDDGRNTVSAGELRPQRVGPCRLGAGRHGYRRLLARVVARRSAPSRPRRRRSPRAPAPRRSRRDMTAIIFQILNN